MRSRNASVGFIIPALAGLAVLGALAVWLAANKDSLRGRSPVAPQAALAQTQTTDRPAAMSCAFGIAPGQAASLNIVNKSSNQGIIIDWKFLAEDNSELKASRDPITVAPGRISSFTIAADETPRPQERTIMRAVIYSLGGPDTFEQNAGLSIEVFDRATGRSTVFLSGAAVKGCSNNL